MPYRLAEFVKIFGGGNKQVKRLASVAPKS
jgi:hypothetical protein